MTSRTSYPKVAVARRESIISTPTSLAKAAFKTSGCCTSPLCHRDEAVALTAGTTTNGMPWALANPQTLSVPHGHLQPHHKWTVFHPQARSVCRRLVSSSLIIKVRTVFSGVIFVALSRAVTRLRYGSLTSSCFSLNAASATVLPETRLCLVGKGKSASLAPRSLRWPGNPHRRKAALAFFASSLVGNEICRMVRFSA